MVKLIVDVSNVLFIIGRIDVVDEDIIAVAI
jgi:hypothetical protein